MQKFKKQFIMIPFVIGLFINNCNSIPEKPKSIPVNDYSYLNEYLNNYIPEQMKEASIIGLSVGVVSDKEVLFAKGFGLADKASGIEVTPDTIFRIASVSKIVNLVIVMKLVEEGKLDLDTDIKKYLPELKIKSRFDSKPITIRSILTHHSGLPSDRQKGFFTHGQVDSLEKLVSDLDGEYTSYPQGFISSYSNLGHSILGRIVEKVTGSTYSNVVLQKIFVPLGMTHSFYEFKPELKEKFSKGYGGLVFRSEVNEPKLRDLPAGFLNSSVNDLSKFIQVFLNNGKVGNTVFLKEKTLEEMYKVQNAGNPYDDDLQIGLGFFLNTFDLGNNILTLQHGGDTFLFHAMLGILPREKLGVIALSNSITSAPLVHSVAKQSLAIALETKTGYKANFTEPKSRIATNMSSFSGFYQNGNLMKVEVENGKVFSAIATGAKFILPDKESEWQDAKIKVFGLFTVNPPNLKFKFKTVGQNKLIYIKAGGTVLLWGSKIESTPDSISPSWKVRLGKYKILNDDLDNASMLKSPELKIENGFLVFESNGIPASNMDTKLTLALKILNEKEAIVDGLGRGKGDTVSVKSIGGKEILTYSGYEMEKIK
ncbi:MAG: beta-lactamase family protein [Leptospiraceae bacterium]|nr:beta-lactamase family protein [Leptospiraceae bacterium]